jgi:hypothetical protein
MNPYLSRLLARRQSQHPSSRATTSLTNLETARQALHACLADCDGDAVHRLRRHIDAARTHRDLWMQRAQVYQVVSLQHGQLQAHARIEALQPVFTGWVDLRSAIGRQSHSGWNSLTC